MSELQFTQEGIREGKAWWVQETPHYVILFDEAARELLQPQKFATQAETRLRQIAGVLGLNKDNAARRYPIGEKIIYFVHDRATCTHGNVDVGGIDVPATGRAWFYRHEESHAVLIRVVGALPPLFNEGFATFVEQPGSTRHHRITLAALRQNVLPSLLKIVDAEGFWRHWGTYSPFMYSQAGSFVEYLFKRFGRGKFISLGMKFSRSPVLQGFRQAYGMSLAHAEVAWHGYLLRRRRALPLLTRIVRGRQSDSRWVREAIWTIKNQKAEESAAADADKPRR